MGYFVSQCRHFIGFISLFSFILIALLMHSRYYLFSDQSYNEWRIIEVAILCILCFYSFIAYPKNTTIFIKSIIFYITITTFISLGLISAVFQAEYTSRALRDWSLYSCLILACINLAHIIHDYPKLAKFTLLLMCCAPIIFIVDFLYQILFYFTVPIDPRPSVLLTWQAQFSYDRIYGDTTLPILFMLAALVSITKNQRLKLFLIATCCAVSIMLMFSGGRGVLISCAVSIILGLLLNKTVRKPLLYFSVNLFFAFLMGLLLVYLLSGDLSQGTVLRGDSSGRIVIIQQALTDFTQAPILGIGPGQLEFNYNKVILSHPHNLFLQILAEWGVIAFLAFITLLLTLFLKITKYVHKEISTFNIFIFLGAVSFIINCNFNGAHIYPSSQIYGLFIFSWLVSIYIIPTITNAESNPKNLTMTYSLPCAALIIALVLVITTNLALGCGGNNAPIEASFGGPRFWLADSPHDDAICKPF